MNTKLLAVALASAISGNALAETTLYGRGNVALDSFNNSAITRTLVSDHYSYFGIKAMEKINKDVAAIFQLESKISLDESTGTDNVLGSRNSFVGLTGSYGTLMLGHHDNPFKSLNKNFVEIYGGGEVSEPILHQHQAETNALSFQMRQENMVQYISPSWEGFGFRFMYAPDENKNTLKDARRMGLSASYSWKDALDVGFAYDHRADDGDKPNVSAKAWKLMASYFYKPSGTTATVALTRLKRSAEKVGSTVIVKEFTRPAWGLLLQQEVGKMFMLKFGFAYAKETVEKAKDGAKMYTLEGAALLSKQAQAYAYFSKISNDINGYYGFKASHSSTSFVPSAVGESPRLLGIGLRYTF